MRTQQEILDRIKEVEKGYLLGTQRADLINHLDFEHARPFLKDHVTQEEWEGKFKPPKETMTEYLPFAWEKANNKRGISASRSIEHYISWLWLDGDDELWRTLDDEYEYYGKPQLIAICEYLGVDHQQYDDGVRKNF